MSFFPRQVYRFAGLGREITNLQCHLTSIHPQIRRFSSALLSLDNYLRKRTSNADGKLTTSVAFAVAGAATGVGAAFCNASADNSKSAAEQGYISWLMSFVYSSPQQRALSTTVPDSEKASESVPVVYPHVTLYQYEPCPFCNKVKAYLDFANVPWSAVEVDPLFKKEIKFSEYKKVPVIVFGDSEQINDSDEIIDHILAMQTAAQRDNRSALVHLPHVATEGSSAAVSEQQWRSWVNTKLVHLLTANIYNTWTESIQTFDYLLTHGNFPKYQQTLSRYSGAMIMYALSKLKLNKKYGIERPREELYAELDAYIAAVGDNRFLGQSDAPTLADLAVFGVLRAIADYPTFADIMANTRVGPWYFRMASVVGASSRIAADHTAGNTAAADGDH